MSKVILIVDDSVTIRQQVSFVLKKAGFEVLAAEDGAVGLTEFQKDERIGLVISDVNMPNVNGLEFLANLRKVPKGDAIPFIMLTTEGSKTLIDQAKSLGAKGWLVKPFAPEALVAAVNKLCL